MAYVITETCIDLKDGSCIDVCPVSCIYGTDDDDDLMSFIQPDQCIDCGACEQVCPNTSIFSDAELPEQLKQWVGINAEYFQDRDATRGKVKELKSD